MMRPTIFCVNASARRVRQICQLQRPMRDFISQCSRRSRYTSSYRPSSCNVTLFGPFDIAHRQLSAGNDSNGESSSSPGINIIESAAATAQWKRNNYRKIEDRFAQPQKEGNDPEKDENTTTTSSSSHDRWEMSSPEKLPEPESVDEYEDVQPMWKSMESRVTKRRSLTLEQSGGKSGRRNVRKSEEDLWLEAGVYDSDKSKKE
eukprot:CAMPEP_0201886986 /NCGR_PEP_ID=MMETSP0902-20130614/23736_1 /ASSEMBLY_ACC=CAM_ASM_000551 /TAXON_ID=420261 /ORGANISM="Thalassiosira antarctica, Strain CCMP982" /LENGTH=203 /DNA_ID=CAMNT_0048416761 /DNA_START=31 /DNA_END=642 /DNA_ORIENTATION=-